MRKIFALFFTSICSAGMLYYLGDRVLTPYNHEGIIQLPNVHIILSLLLVILSTFIAGIHLVIDRVLFRKFYQTDRALLGLRRGVLVGVGLIGLVYLKIFGFLSIENIILFELAVLLIELLAINISSFRPSTESKEVRKERNVDK